MSLNCTDDTETQGRFFSFFELLNFRLRLFSKKKKENLSLMDWSGDARSRKRRPTCEGGLNRKVSRSRKSR